MHPAEVTAPQRMGQRGAHADEHALRRRRPRVAADRARRHRQSRDMAGTLGNHRHVGIGHADVLGGDITPAEPLDDVAERAQQSVGLRGRRHPDHHALAAAHRQSGHGVLVTHAARQPQRVRERRRVIVIGPPARATGGRSECRRMDRDDRGQPGRGIMGEMHRFVRVEIGGVKDHYGARKSGSCTIAQ